MNEMLEGFKTMATKYKSGGASVLKTMAIELFLERFHGDFIEAFAEALKDIPPEKVAGFVHGKEALPLPEYVFKFLHGFEDYLEKLEPARIFEWIAEANPGIAQAIMDLGDEGIGYMINLKQFILDSARAAAAEEIEQVEDPGDKEESPGGEEESPPQEGEPPATKTKMLTCSECSESWKATEEEADQTEKCPFCGAPA